MRLSGQGSLVHLCTLKFSKQLPVLSSGGSKKVRVLACHTDSIGNEALYLQVTGGQGLYPS